MSQEKKIDEFSHAIAASEPKVAANELVVAAESFCCDVTSSESVHVVPFEPHKLKKSPHRKPTASPKSSPKMKQKVRYTKIIFFIAAF